MKELTDTEIQWLEAFAKTHEFFASFLLHYKLKQYLSNNQYYWLYLYINQAEEDNDASEILVVIHIMLLLSHY